jgi:hypothetical protein
MDKGANFLVNLFLLLIMVGVLLLVVQGVSFWRHSSSFHVARCALPAIMILIGGGGLRLARTRLGQR